MQTAGNCKSFRATFVNEDNGRYLEEGAGLRQAFSFFLCEMWADERRRTRALFR